MELKKPLARCRKITLMGKYTRSLFATRSYRKYASPVGVLYMIMVSAHLPTRWKTGITNLACGYEHRQKDDVSRRIFNVTSRRNTRLRITIPLQLVMESIVQAIQKKRQKQGFQRLKTLRLVPRWLFQIYTRTEGLTLHFRLVGRNIPYLRWALTWNAQKYTR